MPTMRSDSVVSASIRSMGSANPKMANRTPSTSTEPNSLATTTNAGTTDAASQPNMLASGLSLRTGAVGWTGRA